MRCCGCELCCGVMCVWFVRVKLVMFSVSTNCKNGGGVCLSVLCVECGVVCVLVACTWW